MSTIIIRIPEGYAVFDRYSNRYFTLTRDIYAGQLGFVLHDDKGELYDSLYCLDVSYAARRAYQMASWYLRHQNWLKKQKARKRLLFCNFILILC